MNASLAAFLLITPWLAFDLYFLVMSLGLLLLRNRPLIAASKLEAFPCGPDVAVVLIPTFNNAKTVLSGLLPRLNELRGKNGALPMDVVIVDSSTDGTESRIIESLGMEWMEKTGDRHVARKGNLAVIHLNNRQGGKAWALTSVAMGLRAKYFAILDSDWVLSFDEFKKGVHYLELHPDRVYAQLAWRAADRPMNTVAGIDQVSIEYRHQLENRVRIWRDIPMTIHGSAVVLRTQAFQDAGGFDSGVLSEDVDLAVRFMLKGQFGQGLADLSMQENPCDHWRQFFWQKARWAEGRSQMLRRHAEPIIASPHLTPRQKLFWLYYLSYFGRCVAFAFLFGVFLFGVLFKFAWASSIGLTLLATLGLRFAGHMETWIMGTNKIPLRCRLLEPFSFYGIGLIYAFTFFKGLLLNAGEWHVIESKA